MVWCGQRQVISRRSLVDANITGWVTPALVSSNAMFAGATAWLSKYKRDEDGFNGPPSAWSAV
jgi:hypothetical protein